MLLAACFLPLSGPPVTNLRRTRKCRVIMPLPFCCRGQAAYSATASARGVNGLEVVWDSSGGRTRCGT
jgi:hypothetical protein